MCAVGEFVGWWEERGGKEKLEGGGKLEAWMEHVEGADDDS